MKKKKKKLAFYPIADVFGADQYLLFIYWFFAVTQVPMLESRLVTIDFCITCFGRPAQDNDSLLSWLEYIYVSMCVYGGYIYGQEWVRGTRIEISSLSHLNLARYFIGFSLLHTLHFVCVCVWLVCVWTRCGYFELLAWSANMQSSRCCCGLGRVGGRGWV